MSASDRAAFDTRDRCPACGSNNSRTRFECAFDDRPIAPFIESYYGIDPARLGGRYRAEQCNDCATYFQAEVGNPDLLTQLYSEWVFDIGDPMRDPLYAFDVGHPRQSRDGHEVMAAAATLGVPLAQLRTLDFGMGWASWARISASLGCDSFGYDLSAERMAYAASFGIEPHMPGNAYHFINTEQVVEHLPDPLGTVRALAEALLPGGILKVSLPSPRGLDRLLGRLEAGKGTVAYEEIMPLQPLEHLNCFSRAGLRALSERAGLRLVRPFLRAFAFLGHSGTLDPRHPSRMAKELVRPAYQLINPRNHYVWMRKAS